MLSLALHRKIHFLLLSIGLALLPFVMLQKSGFRFSGFWSILIMANVLFALPYWWKEKQGLKHPMVGLVLVFIGVYLIFLPFAPDFNRAINALLLWLNILFSGLSLQLFYPKEGVQKQLIPWLLGGLFISSLYIFREGIWVFKTAGLDKDCLFCVVELLVPMHRPYYGLLMAIALYWIVQELWKKELPFSIRLLFLFLLIYFTAYLLLMFPKVVLVAIIFGLIFIYLPIKNRLIRSLALGISLLVASTVIIQTTESSENTNIEGYTNQFGASMEVRQKIWQASFQSLTESPTNFLFGTGLGNEQATILNYTKDIDKLFEEKKFNTHNQYLSLWLQMGVIGLFIAIAFIMIPFYYLEPTNKFGTFICIIFAFCWLTENMLQREAGVMAYAWIFIPIIGGYLQTKNKEQGRA